MCSTSIHLRGQRTARHDQSQRGQRQYRAFGLSPAGDWATATFEVRSSSWSRTRPSRWSPTSCLRHRTSACASGNADGELVLPAPIIRTRVIISVDEVDLTGLGSVWIDLVAADA